MEQVSNLTYPGLFNSPIKNRRNTKPLLITISAPSGAGKTTLCNRLVKEFENIEYSISCTTRKPRGNEEDGVDYYFLSGRNFKKLIKKNEFLEFAKVHGNHYGTLIDTIQFAMEGGQHIILDIDVQGVAQIRSKIKTMEENSLIKRGFLDIFIEPPSFDILEKRLRMRSTDNQKAIKKRLKNAKKELKEAKYYNHRIVNNDLDQAYKELCMIINSSS